MRITPLDIHEQTFRMSFRGFDPVEVDAFLQRVADEVERLTEERDTLRTELEAERKRRQILEEGLAAAQSVQQSIVESARAEAEVLRNQAQLRADRILAEANEDLVHVRRAVQVLRDRRSLWLSDLAGLAQSLTAWVEEKSKESISPPELIAEPDGEADPAMDEGPELGDAQDEDNGV